MKTFLAALILGLGVLTTGPAISAASAEPKKVDRNSEEHRRWQEEFRRRHGIEEPRPAPRPANPQPNRTAPANPPASTAPATPPAR